MALLGGTVRWSRQALSVSIVPVEGIAQRFEGRHCPLGIQERLPPADLEGEVGGSTGRARRRWPGSRPGV